MDPPDAIVRIQLIVFQEKTTTSARMLGVLAGINPLGREITGCGLVGYGVYAALVEHLVRR